jgi:hypothetical protein
VLALEIGIWLTEKGLCDIVQSLLLTICLLLSIRHICLLPFAKSRSQIQCADRLGTSLGITNMTDDGEGEGPCA